MFNSKQKLFFFTTYIRKIVTECNYMYKTTIYRLMAKIATVPDQNIINASISLCLYTLVGNLKFILKL